MTCARSVVCICCAQSYIYVAKKKKTFSNIDIRFYYNACSIDMGKKEPRASMTRTKFSAMPQGLEMTALLTTKRLTA